MKRDDYDDGTTNTKLLFVVTTGLVIIAILGCIGLITIISDVSVTNSSVVFTPTLVENQTVNTTQTVNSTVENQTVIQRSNLTMSVIDVGQADAILLEKDGVELLIDAGVSMKGSSASKKNLIDYLDDREIEHVLVTHQDYDHIGNAEYVLANYNVSAFYDNGHVHTSQTYENLMDYVAENDLDYSVLKTGNTLDIWEGVNVTVVSPKRLTDDVNEDSIVLFVDYDDVEILLTGDAGVSVESNVAKLVGDIDILKVGHHGSDSASSDDFLKIIKPEISIISVGEGNSYGHPTESVLSRLSAIGSDVYRTDADGTIVVETDGLVYSVVV